MGPQSYMQSVDQNIVIRHITVPGVRVKIVGSMTTCTQNLLNLVGNVHCLWYVYCKWCFRSWLSFRLQL